MPNLEATDEHQDSRGQQVWWVWGVLWIFHTDRSRMLSYWRCSVSLLCSYSAATGDSFPCGWALVMLEEIVRSRHTVGSDLELRSLNPCSSQAAAHLDLKLAHLSWMASSHRYIISQVRSTPEKRLAYRKERKTSAEFFSWGFFLQ